ncbi:LysR family transcriptional regulator [Pseudonocardia sp. ICBG1293]|uniref:LysR family transcriptional regulator n=1 Tax=Pseudonocardia sp. ICBG1293 TaxID=2844382 RepID=UPI001CCFA7A1|nr:LysR family transcriptional regulator [Pseudonocardia sp. ICBG1293]
MWDLHRLRLLHELRLRETVTAVARTLDYSLSSVSQQLAKLEDEVGVRLLEPDGRRLRLAPEGLRVAAHAARVLDLEEDVRSELQAGLPVAETVRIASLESTARALVPHALTALRETAPHLRLEAAVVPPETGLAELEARGYDIAVAEQYPGHTREHRDLLDRTSLGHDPVRLVVPRDAAVTDLAGAAGLPWVMEPEGTAARYWAVQQCRAAGFEPDIRFDSASLDVHVHLIRAGHAAGLLPDLVWTGDRSGVRTIALPGPSHRELFTSVRRTTRDRPSIRAVRAALSRAFDALGPPQPDRPGGGAGAPARPDVADPAGRSPSVSPRPL